MIDARDTALIIEGGGMRNSYTAPAIVKLIQEEVQFGWVGGISAGAVHAVNLASRDIRRAKSCFTDFVGHPDFGGWRTMVRGKGFLNSDFIYGASSEQLPLDFTTFQSTEEEVHIEATRADTGETVVWNRRDLSDEATVTEAVRASSTLPLIMPVTHIDGLPFVDGALGNSGGLLIDAAQRAGYEKFLILATRPRDYIRGPVTHQALVKRLLRKYPVVAEAQFARPQVYNALKQRAISLEDSGHAQLFFPNALEIESTERDVAKLLRSYAAGEAQVEQEWPAWEKFLHAGSS